MSNSKEIIIGIISEIIDVESSEIKETDTVGEIGEWDSVHNMMIIATLEEKFGINYPPESIFEMTDIKSIISETQKLING